MYRYSHLVQLYETDLMGIVHHANYLRFLEESRVSWAHSAGMLDYQNHESASHLAVIETQVKHIKPAYFGDHLEIQLQAMKKGIRIIFEYKVICKKRNDEVIVEARTVHAPLNKELKLIRLPEKISSVLEKELWTETWLSSL